MDNMKPTSIDKNVNSFGLLRLVFACMVILAHAPEIYDGSKKNELLYGLFGTMTFGELAVNCFFIISGFLITSSYLNTRTPADYLRKRVARIYPGYLASYVFCVVIVANIAGNHLDFSILAMFRWIIFALLLQPVDVGPVFVGTPYAFLNGSTWTIAYEFRCYLLILFAGYFGLLTKRNLVLAGAIVFVLLSLVAQRPDLQTDPTQFAYVAPDILSLRTWKAILIGDVRNSIRFLGFFLAGASFFLFYQSIRFTALRFLAAMAILCLFLFSRYTANIGLAFAGAYAIFYLSQSKSLIPLSRPFDKFDVSYGVYLYAWPINKMAIYYFPQSGILFTGALTFLASLALGSASWILIERPTLDYIRRSRRG